MMLHTPLSAEQSAFLYGDHRTAKLYVLVALLWSPYRIRLKFAADCWLRSI
eukprot:COSAG01_NODE_1848_length_9066_cov_6.023754_6_plen_51_part_00